MSDMGPLSGSSDNNTDAHPSEFVSGRLISLRFIVTALRRRRRLWVGLAALGLLIGAGYHIVTPPTYWGTATLFLAHPAGSNDGVVSANDLALIGTVDVGKRAVALLHEAGVSPLKILGAAPASVPSDNIMVLKIVGPTPTEAVRRVNAVAEAYLAFRSQQYGAQNQVIVSATTKQIDKFQTEVGRLTRQINTAPASKAGQLANLIAQRSTLESQITNLQQTVQSDNLAAISVTQGSRVVTGGTLVLTSRTKSIAMDGATGLVGGLAVGLMLVAVRAVTSDLLWRREDIADVLGVPVELSIARARRWRWRRGSAAKQAARPRPSLQSMVHFLHDRLTKDGSRRVGLVVAADDVRPAAAGVAALAGRLSSAGREVVVIDATMGWVLGKAFGVARPGARQVRVGNSPEVTVVAPPQPWETDGSDEWWERMQDQWAHADTVLVVATIDPAYGAGHLTRWASEAVVTITAGRSTAQHINVVAELLEAAAVSVSSAVLVGADTSDESIGLPDPTAPRSRRRPGIISSTGGALPVREPR